MADKGPIDHWSTSKHTHTKTAGGGHETVTEHTSGSGARFPWKAVLITTGLFALGTASYIAIDKFTGSHTTEAAGGPSRGEHDHTGGETPPTPEAPSPSWESNGEVLGAINFTNLPPNSDALRFVVFESSIGTPRCVGEQQCNALQQVIDGIHANVPGLGDLTGVAQLVHVGADGSVTVTVHDQMDFGLDVQGSTQQTIDLGSPDVHVFVGLQSLDPQYSGAAEIRPFVPRTSATATAPTTGTEVVEPNHREPEREGKH